MYNFAEKHAHLVQVQHVHTYFVLKPIKSITILNHLRLLMMRGS